MPKGVYKHIHTPWNKGLKIRLNPSGEFKKGFTPWNKGKKHTQETKDKVSRTKKSQNRRMSEEEKTRLSEYNKRVGRKPPVIFGKDNNQWKGGLSYEVYPREWNKTLKRAIRERDKYTCQMCGGQPDNEALSVHHIDYNKYNCNPVNLVALCRSCHRKTNDNREEWIKYFEIWVKNSYLKTQLLLKKYSH